jgi:hypothetical protein
MVCQFHFRLLSLLKDFLHTLQEVSCFFFCYRDSVRTTVRISHILVICLINLRNMHTPHYRKCYFKLQYSNYRFMTLIAGTWMFLTIHNAMIIEII